MDPEREKRQKMRGKEIAALCASAGCPSTYAAQKQTGKDNRMIGRIFNGETSPTIGYLDDLFDAMGYRVILSIEPKPPE